MNEFNGKKIVLTGASRGIGCSLMMRLSELGAELIVVARDYDLLKTQTENMTNISIFKADLSDEEQVQNFVDYVAARWDGIDILINNAGVQTNVDFFNFNNSTQMLKRLNDEILLNFATPVMLTLKFLPLLMHNRDHHQKAKIVNIGSGLGRVPKMTSPVYAGTKAAIEVYSRAFSYQCEGRAINVQIVVPDVVATDMTKNYTANPTLTADQAAEQILVGMQSDQLMIYLGRTKLLYLIHRFLPQLAHRIIRKGTDSQYYQLRNKTLDF